jgi:signal transduction histidine kinase
VELYPPVLYDDHLAQVLEWLAACMKRHHRLEVNVKADPDPFPMAEESRVILFHAVRELLFNVGKHAGTNRANLRMSRLDGDRVRVVVSDEGVGFAPIRPASAAATSGFGLFSIRERLEPLGGSLTVESQPGRGTRVTLIVPARGEEAEASAAKERGASGGAEQTRAEASGEPVAAPGRPRSIGSRVVSSGETVRGPFPGVGPPSG